MNESPIELRGKSGGVVFQGTQSPGGGSQPGAMRMLGPFTIGPDDFVGPDGFGFMAALLYTPTAGDAIIGFSWILRAVFSGDITDGFAVAPQTSADTGTAGPPLVTADSAGITLVNAQGQGPGNTGGDYCASVFLPFRVSISTGGPDAPSVVGPVISDGTALYLSGSVPNGFDPGGQLDIYVYVATPALA